MEGIQWAEIALYVTALTPLYVSLFRRRKSGSENGNVIREQISTLKGQVKDIDKVWEEMTHLRQSMESLRVELSRADTWMRDLARIDSEVLRLRERLHEHSNFIHALTGRVDEIEEKGKA